MSFQPPRRQTRLPCLRGWLVLVAGLLLVAVASGQPSPDAALAGQHERLEQQRRVLDAAAPLPPPRPAGAVAGPVAGESPCVVLRQLSIEAASDSAAAPPADVLRLAELPGPLASFTGACLGVQGLQNLQATLQQRLQAAGWLTSRLSLPAQNFGEGRLRLLWHAGMLQGVHWQPHDGSPAPGGGALAVQPGQVLNLRDIEQSHENLARVPSLASQFQVTPGSAADTSVLVIQPQGGRRWRGVLGMAWGDAAGSSGLQWHAGLSVDAPLGLGDALSLSWTQSAQRTGRQPAQASWLVHLGVPWGPGLLSASLSGSGSARSIAGGVGRFTEGGTDTQAQLRWQYTVWRSAEQRISLSTGLGSLRARAAIDGTELRVRRRDSARLDIGASWYRLHGCGDSNLALDLGQAVWLRRDALFQAAADGRPAFWRLEGNWRCAWGAGRADADAWMLDLRGWLHTVRRPVGSTDLVYLGGEASVRGHRPAAALAGLAAAALRIDVHAPAWQLAEPGAVLTRLQASAGWDIGHLRQPLRGDSPGQRHRSGLAITLRGQWQVAGWTGQADLGLAHPLRPAADGAGRRTLWQAGLSAAY